MDRGVAWVSADVAAGCALSRLQSVSVVPMIQCRPQGMTNRTDFSVRRMIPDVEWMRSRGTTRWTPLESFSRDPDAFALRVKGDSMHPAIRHGHFVVVEPSGRCVPGEYVAIELLDGQKMVKELIYDRPTEVVVESANGNRRMTFERTAIKHMYAVASIVSPSKWREG